MIVNTEQTPNPETLKFLPGKKVSEAGPIEVHKKDLKIDIPLAKNILSIKGTSMVFFAEDIITVLNNSSRNISRATVYNTLNLFADKGLVQRVVIDSSKIYYDSKTTPHSHYFNVDTGEISDFEFEDVNISPIPKLPENTVQDGVDIIVRVKNSK